MPYRYPLAARLLHWLTALLVLVMVTLGVWMTMFEPKDEAFKFLLYDIHESTGVVVFVVVVVRLARRLTNPPAPLPDSIPALFRYAGGANHAVLYALLLVQPITGFLATNAWGFPVVWAHLIPLPSPIGKNEALAPLLSTLHNYGALLLVAAVAAHISGAAFHALVRRDGVVQRMV